MLKKFTFKNFKQYRHEVTVDFEPVTVLLGANNSGKSTVLQALSIFQYCLETVRQKKNGHITLETTTVGPEEFGPLPVTTPADLWPNGKTTSPICLKAEFDDGTTLAFEIKNSFNRFGITPIPDGPQPAALENWRARYVPIHSGLAPREEYLLAPARNDRLREQQHGRVIRNLLWDLKENHSKRWKVLLEVLKRLFPNSNVDVTFDKDVERFIRSDYGDTKLEKSLDVIVAGTGFQQVLQIFSSVLAQGSTLVLLDEPDAHLHAKLQVEMMAVFSDLVREEGIQFIMASHSPHLLSSAPTGSLRVMIEGKAHPFAVTSAQIELLDSLGAIDRMEVVPLLRTKSVVFLENRDDRKLLEHFAIKKWGEAKMRVIWSGLTFLYTYQNPIDASAHLRAKQVKDLLESEGLQGLASGRQPRFLVIGDRDYRNLTKAKADQREIEKKAKSAGLKVDLKCHLWSRNEIENYLMDRDAVSGALVAKLKDAAQSAATQAALEQAWPGLLEAQKADVQGRIADRLQKEDRGVDYRAATLSSQEMIGKEWDDGTALCDAKLVLSGVRKLVQDKKLPTHLDEGEIVKHLKLVPADVAKVLALLKEHSATTPKKKIRKPAPQGAAAPVPAQT